MKPLSKIFDHLEVYEEESTFEDFDILSDTKDENENIYGSRVYEFIVLSFRSVVGTDTGLGHWTHCTLHAAASNCTLHTVT